MRSSDSRYGMYSDNFDSGRDIADTLEELIIMVIVMALAAAIRLWKLGEWSFWADEIFSVQDARNIPAEFPINPAMYMIIRFFINTFGTSEWSARLGACIIGILSVPLLYWPAKRIFNAKVGVIACLFLVIHPWHIYWSQNARAYSLAFLLSGLAAFFFYLALERDSVGFTIFSVFLTILSVLSYPQSAVLIIALGGYVFLLMFLPAGIPRGFNGKNLFVFFVPFILSLFALLSPSVRSYLVEGWGANEFGRGPLYILFTLVFCLGVPIAVASFAGGLHSLVYMNRGGLFLICYAAIPLVIFLIISPFQNVAGYYLFFTVPAYLLLAAFSTSELIEAVFRKSKVLSVTMLLIILVALISQTYMYFAIENGGRPKWREAFKTVGTGAYDVVVVSMPRIAEYYLQEHTGDGSSAQVMQLKDVIQQRGTLEDQWRRDGKSVWFVLDQPSLRIRDSDRTFRDWLYANCRLVKEFPVYARVKDRTISLWNLKYINTEVNFGLPDVFDEGFIF